MRVFVTGASGHLGSAVLPELHAAGHQVLGLARSSTAADAVAERNAEVVRGDLDDLDILREAAAEADAVIHLAFRHDLMQTGDRAGALEVDTRAIEAMLGALAGSGKPFVGTSGTLLLAQAGLDRTGTEQDAFEGGEGRIRSENTVVAAAERGVRSSVVRLPPTVHSSLDTQGYVPAIIELARAHGFSAYVGDGANRWPAVHTLDAARLYRLALEHAPAGTRLHAVHDEGVPFREIAETIGRRLDLPVKSVSPEEAEEHFGFLAGFVQLDGPADAAATRELLGWRPEHAGLLDDLEAEHYFGR